MKDIGIGVYIDMESLFDLRQGFLLTQDYTDTEVLEIITSEEFTQREHDGDLGDGSYNETVASGDLKLLEGMQLTYNASVLKSVLHKIISTSQTQGNSTMPVLYLNIFPFSISARMLEMFKDGLYHVTEGTCFIEIISLDPKELSVSRVLDLDLSHIFSYDFGMVRTAFGDRLMTGEINHVELSCPRIYRAKPDEETQELVDELAKKGYDDLYEIHTLTLSAYIAVEFRSPVFYTNALISTPYINELTDKIKKHHEERFKDFNQDEGMLDEYFGEHI